MATRKYELKKGVLLQTFGDASKTCTNDTITDELGDWYMANDPSKLIFFSRYPGTPEVAPNIKIIPPTNIPQVEIIPPTKVEPEASDIASTLIKTVTQSPNKRGRKSGK